MPFGLGAWATAAAGGNDRWAGTGFDNSRECRKSFKSHQTAALERQEHGGLTRHRQRVAQQLRGPTEAAMLNVIRIEEHGRILRIVDLELRGIPLEVKDQQAASVPTGELHGKAALL
jgi:hypothetical protein